MFIEQIVFVPVFCLYFIKLISSEEKFTVVTEWTHLNYSWRSYKEYRSALSSGRYVPENNAPAGIKIYEDKLFLSIPKFRSGIPATLVLVENRFHNPLLVPFPSWEANDDRDCSNLQSVQSMEIDTRGVMWILDGMRIGNATRCPTKLVLFDINQHQLVEVFVFSNEISPQDGGFLNDIVIDEGDDGDFAYITDHSPIDPGIVIFSRKARRAWKIRDKTMYPDEEATPMLVNDVALNDFTPIDGIALSPKPKHDNNPVRSLYYCAITTFQTYSIPTYVLKDETLCKTPIWRNSIESHGRRVGQSDGIMIDSRGVMYYTLLPLDGVARWNTREPISTSEIVDTNEELMVWPDGFAFDQKGYIYVISNYIYKFANPNFEVRLDGSVQFRVLSLYVGSRSYLYNDLV